MDLLIILLGIIFIFLGKKIKILRKIGWGLLIIGIIIFSIAFFRASRKTLDNKDADSLSDIFRKNLSESRIKANEEVAVVNCKIIHYACWAYHGVWERFPSSLEELGEKKPPYIKLNLAKATTPETSYQGYFYSYECPNPQYFTLIAKPKEIDVTGKSIFFIDDSGKVRLNDVDGPIIEIADKP